MRDNVHMENSLNFGLNLRAVRESLGVSRAELQRRLEEANSPMHMTSLRRIEAGEQEPKLSDAIRIATALGVSVELLSTDNSEYPLLREIEIARGKYKQAVTELCHALGTWEAAGTALFKLLEKAHKTGIPEKLTFETSAELARTSDIDGILGLWEDTRPGANQSWMGYLKEAYHGR